MRIVRAIFMLFGLFFSGVLAADALSTNHLGDSEGDMLFSLVALSIFWTLFWLFGEDEP